MNASLGLQYSSAQLQVSVVQGHPERKQKESNRTLEQWFSQLTVCQNNLEGFLNTDSWTLLPDFLFQEPWVGDDSVYFYEVSR